MKYYIQNHERGYVGNCLLWWRKNGCGYTCNIDDAEIFEDTDVKFQNIVKDVSKYTAWEKNYIDLSTHKHVNCENVDWNLKGVHRSLRAFVND